MNLKTWVKSLDQERAFNEALHDAPWDNVTRLVFADYLEERDANELAAFHRKMAERVDYVIGVMRTTVRTLIDQHMGHDAEDFVRAAIADVPRVETNYWSHRQLMLIALHVVEQEIG